MPPHRGYHTLKQMGAKTPVGIISSPPREIWKRPFMIWTAWGEKKGTGGELNSLVGVKGSTGDLRPQWKPCKGPKRSGGAAKNFASFPPPPDLSLPAHRAFSRNRYVCNLNNGPAWSSKLRDDVRSFCSDPGANWYLRASPTVRNIKNTAT